MTNSMVQADIPDNLNTDTATASNPPTLALRHLPPTTHLPRSLDITPKPHCITPRATTTNRSRDSLHSLHRVIIRLRLMDSNSTAVNMANSHSMGNNQEVTGSHNMEGNLVNMVVSWVDNMGNLSMADRLEVMETREVSMVDQQVATRDSKEVTKANKADIRDTRAVTQGIRCLETQF